MPVGAPHAATPNRSFSPTMHQQSPPAAAAMQLQHGASGSFAELSAFMKEMLERDDRAKQEMEAKLQAKEVQMEAKLAELAPKPAPEAISEEQLVALQARLGGLHVTKLLTDEVRTCISI